MAFLAKFFRVGLSVAVLGGVSLGVTGCSGFFQCENKPSCPSTGTGTGTGTGSTADYAYVSNSSAGSTHINGYAVSAGALTATSSSPYDLGFVPEAMVVSPNNAFLYVATPLTQTGGGIYGYSIGTGGALSLLNSGKPLVSEPAATLAMSPDGKYLFALNSTLLQSSLDEFPADTSAGTLSPLSGSQPYVGASGALVVPTSLVVAPSANFIACVLGTGGVVTFPYTASTGALGTENNTIISPPNSSSGFFAATVDASGNLYVGGTDGIRVYTTNSSGVPGGGATVYTTGGSAPRAMVLNTGYNYVYTANDAQTGTIAANTVGTSGALTTISTTGLAVPPYVTALGVDNSGKYLLAAGSDGTVGIELYSIGTAGALTSVGSAASGTSGQAPTVIAMTH